MSLKTQKLKLKNNFESKFFNKNIYYTSSLNEFLNYDKNEILIYEGYLPVLDLNNIITHSVLEISAKKKEIQSIKCRRSVQENKSPKYNQIKIIIGETRFKDYIFSKNNWKDYKIHIIKKRIEQGAIINTISANGKIVAFLLFSINNKILFLHEIGVKEDFKKLGLAVDLLADVFKKQFVKCISYIYEDNLESLSFFKKIGFKTNKLKYYGKKIK
jgi:ribosomal protein S18 acetylase RimI-like enzyme